MDPGTATAADVAVTVSVLAGVTVALITAHQCTKLRVAARFEASACGLSTGFGEPVAVKVRDATDSDRGQGWKLRT